MAGSCLPGPIRHNPFSKYAPARTPGPLGMNDGADPNMPAKVGDTPGSLGVNDHGELTAYLGHPNGVIGADQLSECDTAEETEFMRKVYDEQLEHAMKRKKFFPGLPAAQLQVVEGKHRMRKDAAQVCRALLAQARLDLQRKQAGHDEHALKVTEIGIASAYRDPQRDKGAWEKTFRKHYKKTKNVRIGLVGGEHGDKAVKFLFKRMRGIKAVPGFSNHTSGIAVDFLTTENNVTLGANTDQKLLWRGTWFYQWLVENAEKYKLEQLVTEEWHWDFKS
jgi:D-alanyl-D-alanine carboxypeptidase